MRHPSADEGEGQVRLLEQNPEGVGGLSLEDAPPYPQGFTHVAWILPCPLPELFPAEDPLTILVDLGDLGRV